MCPSKCVGITPLTPVYGFREWSAAYFVRGKSLNNYSLNAFPVAEVA